MNEPTLFRNGNKANHCDRDLPVGVNGEASDDSATLANAGISSPKSEPRRTDALNPGALNGINHSVVSREPNQADTPGAPIAHVDVNSPDDAADGENENPPAAAAPAKPTPPPGAPLVTGATVPVIEERGAEVLPPETDIYPTSLTPDDTYRVLRRELPEPVFDRPFILSISISGVHDGAQRVAGQHAAIFLSVHGVKMRALDDQERARVRRVAARQREAADLTRDLKNTDRYDDSVAAPGSEPWNLNDRFEIAALVGTSGLCLVIGVANITNILKSSGETAFNEYWKALPFGLGVVIGAVALKAFARLFNEGPQRRAYGFTLFGVGLAAFLWWLGGFSAVFSGALAPVGDLLANLNDLVVTDDSNTHGGSHAGPLMMFAGSLADAALSAGAWIVAHMICNGHRMRRRTESQAWTRVRTDLNRVLKRLHEEEALLGLVRGALECERAQQAVFVNKAVALHDAASASQRQTREALMLQ